MISAVRLPHPAVLLNMPIFMALLEQQTETVAKGGFFMQKNKARGLRNVYVLVSAAMLAAVSVVIGIFCKNFLNFGNGLFRITFENFPIIMSGVVFGPVVGAFVGAISDIISYMLSTQSFAVSPIVTLGAAAVGAVSGIISHYVIKREGNLRVIASVVTAHLVGSVIIKSLGLFVYYEWLVLWRIPTYIIISVLESALLCYLCKSPAFSKIFKLGKGK